MFPNYSSLTLFQLPTLCFPCIVLIVYLSARSPAAEHVIHLHLCLALRLRHIFAATQGFGLCSTGGCCIQDGGLVSLVEEIYGKSMDFSSFLFFSRVFPCHSQRGQMVPSANSQFGETFVAGFTSRPPKNESQGHQIHRESRHVATIPRTNNRSDG